MHKSYIASVAIVFYSFCYNWLPLCAYIQSMWIITYLLIFLSIFAVIWIHILLSSTHKTGAMVEQVNGELDQFRDKLMVRNELTSNL